MVKKFPALNSLKNNFVDRFELADYHWAMTDREKPHFSQTSCNNKLITVIEKGAGLGRIPFEKLPPKEARSLFEVLHELYSDGAGI